MTAVSDPELLAFAAELLENYGGLIEPESLLCCRRPARHGAVKPPKESDSASSSAIADAAAADRPTASPP